jgi:nitrile hydratase subunit alpha
MTDHHRAAGPLTDVQVRVKALAAVLAEKNMVQQETLDAIVEHYEKKVGPHRGARIVARAWTDPAFRDRLLKDASGAIAEMGFADFVTTHVMAKENTPTVHNLVVCTLCSCYPWGVLGLPPTWYKSAPYRARAVRDPRGLLKEFGVILGENVEISGLGQHGRDPLSRGTVAARRNGRHVGGSARKTGEPRFHDRHRRRRKPELKVRPT